MEAVVGSILDSVHKNLLDGDAYLTVLEGLAVTIKISFLGLLLGTAWGATLCWARLSRYSVARACSSAVVAALRGSPVLLLLMMLYYVVFANSRINPTMIAVIAFGLNSGAHICELMRSAIEAVDKRQAEAARMLGFSSQKAFMAITLPQASKIAKPVYQNTVINTIQWTSVVGYVTITDLTRTLNNIGNRTGDPFFSLFFGVLIYVGLSSCVTALFSMGEKKREE